MAAAAAAAPAPGDAPAAAAPQYTRSYMLGTTVLYSLTLFTIGLCLGGRGAALLGLAKQTGIIEQADDDDVDLSSLSMIGWAMTAYALGFMLCSVISGYLLDSVENWHRLLSGSGVVTAVALGLVTVVETPGLLVVSFCLLGSSLAFPVVSSSSAAPTWVWGAECGPSVHAINASFGVGMGMAPFLVSLNLNHNDSFHMAFGFITVLCAVIALGPLCMKSPTKPPEAAASADAADPAEEGGDKLQQASFLAKPSTLWLLFYTIFVFNISAELVFGVWATAYAEVSGLVPSADAPMVAATFYWCYTSFRILTAFASGYISPTKLIFGFGYPVLAVGQVLIILSAAERAAPWLLWTGAIVSGIGLAPIFGSVFALFAEYNMPPPGRIVGIMWCLTNAGDIGAQNIASALFSAKRHDLWPVLTLCLFAGGCATIAVARVFALPAHRPAPKAPKATAAP